MTVWTWCAVCQLSARRPKSPSRMCVRVVSCSCVCVCVGVKVGREGMKIAKRYHHIIDFQESNIQRVRFRVYKYVLLYLKGWQMAMYRSTVNEVIVSTVALVDVSDSRPCRMHSDWITGYVAGYQMLYVSTGNPVEDNSVCQVEFCSSLNWCQMSRRLKLVLVFLQCTHAKWFNMDWLLKRVKLYHFTKCY